MPALPDAYVLAGHRLIERHNLRLALGLRGVLIIGEPRVIDDIGEFGVGSDLDAHVLER